MLTVLATADYMKIGCDPKMFFDLNGDPYRIVEDDRDGPVDILLTYPWYRQDEAKQLQAQYQYGIAVELDLWHGFENCLAKFIEMFISSILTSLRLICSYNSKI